MTNISLAMYKFNIRVKKSRKKEENFLSFDQLNKNSNNYTVYDLLKTILTKNSFINDNLRITDVLEFNSDENYVSGLLYLGEYGNVRKRYDKETEKYKSDISKEDVICEPFFFIFSVPLDSKFGFLILEKKKSKPIISSFFNGLKERIDEKIKNGKIPNEISFDFIPVVPKEIHKQVLEKGIIKEFIFLDNTENKESYGDKNIISKSKRFTVNIKNSNLQPSTVSEIKEDIHEMFNIPKRFNTLKMKVIYGKQNKETTLDLSDLFEGRIYLDITDEITLGNDNNPEYTSLKEVSIKYIKSNFSYYYENRSVLDND